MASSLLDICARYVVVNEVEYNDEILLEDYINIIIEMKEKIRLEKATLLLNKIIATNTIKHCILKIIHLKRIKRKRNYETRIMHAAYNGNLDVVKYLIKNNCALMD